MKPDKFHWGLLVALQLLLIGCGAEPPPSSIRSEGKCRSDAAIDLRRKRYAGAERLRGRGADHAQRG